MLVEYVFYSKDHYIGSIIYRNESLGGKVTIKDTYRWVTGSKNYLTKSPYNMQVAIL